ncbi:MAG: hypothetical protein Q4G27_08705 [Flavobacteriaceae bacterium]|nr:hypothetical protein [Flavobacteriaceae bacterium]
MKNLYYFFLFIFVPIWGQDVLISENFENGIPQDWVINSTNKQRNWFAKSFRDVHYVQMSAFGGRGKPGYVVKAELHSPLFEISQKTCKLRFSFADAYQNGQPLQVLLTNEKFLPIRGLNEKYWADLVNNPDKYDNEYEATPWIDLPQINQPCRVSFIYNSKPNDEIITTIIQLKEVDVWCE